MENSKKSFVSVLKRGSQSHVTPEITKPALVLNETCIKVFDFGMSLMGRAKVVFAIPNLPCIISKESFQDVKLSYLGGMWVLFEFDSLASKEKFLNHFVIINERRKVIIQGKFYWIRVKELDAWFPNVQEDDQDDLSSDGKSQEGDVANKADNNKSDADRVSELCFMHENDTAHKDKSKVGRSILDLMDELVTVGQTMGYNMAGLGDKAIRRWIKELCQKHRINFSSIQETKAESISLHTIKDLWGNQMFDHVVGFFCSGELNERSDLWDYLRTFIDRWEGDIVVMGDFNEVRSKHEKNINIQQNLSEVDTLIDQGKSNHEILIKRITLLNDLQKLNNRNAMEISQKSKIRWSIEGDENSKYFHGEVALKVLYKRLYALEMCKSISVAEKMGHPSLSHSFRRMPRGGVELENYGLLCSKVADLMLSNILDRWYWSLEGSQEFSVKSSRILIDNTILPKTEVPTRWLRVVPIKKSIALWEFSTMACSLIR
nr:RNA-directed DNA polymerase, eukaryota [Tanacetum cinerariifolium]